MHLVDLKAHRKVGFSFIGVLMDDLITAAATIHAAQIQANYTLWAASISSIVGAAGIIFAAWYAWQSGIKLHQHNNIIEAKRDVYLDAIVKYQQFANDFNLIFIAPERFLEVFFNNKREFLISINKVQLICDTANKETVIDLRDKVEKLSSEILDKAEGLIKANDLLIEHKKRLSIAKIQLKEFQEKERYNERIYSASHYHKGKDLNEELRLSKEELLDARKDLASKKQLVNEKISDFEKHLSGKYKEFSNVLRAELKIEN